MTLWASRGKAGGGAVERKPRPPEGVGWILSWATTFRDEVIAAKGPHGNRTATRDDVLAALPHPSMLNHEIECYYEATDMAADVTVLDVGPWSISDAYWLEPEREPEAVRKHIAYSKGQRGPEARDFKNRLVISDATLDLSEAAWDLLGVTDAYTRRHSGWVWWRPKP
jgi:hypothetical protein